MKAVFFREHGGPEVLTYGNVSEPKIGPEDVLVRVKACALNRLDMWVVAGKVPTASKRPHIPGCDVAGIVAKVGARVKHVVTGERVMLAPGVSCGRCEDCLLGNDHLCARYEILGQNRPGGYAEFVAAPAANAVPMPDGLDFEEAAAIPLVFITAWNLLVNRAKVQAGETVLVHAGGSGVGIAAIQIANLFSARVLTTVGSDAKASKARAVGADEVINYAKKDFVAATLALTNQRGADVVLDHIGQATFEKSLAATAKNGRLVVFGTTTGADVKFNLRQLFSRNVSILGGRMGPKTALYEAARFVATGQYEPVVDKVFPLKKASDALRHLESRKTFGKVVLAV